MLGGVAGVVNPIIPLPDAAQLAAILRASSASVLVTMKSFPKSEVAQAAALQEAPNVKRVLEVDLNRHRTPPKSWTVPLVHPKSDVKHSAVRNFNKAADSCRPDGLDFEYPKEDRVVALLHIGGTAARSWRSTGTRG